MSLLFDVYVFQNTCSLPTFITHQSKGYSFILVTFTKLVHIVLNYFLQYACFPHTIIGVGKTKPKLIISSFKFLMHIGHFLNYQRQMIPPYINGALSLMKPQGKRLKPNYIPYYIYVCIYILFANSLCKRKQFS